jgi:hypothetical protein
MTNTTDPIIGFSLDVTAKELGEYAGARAKHHASRAALYTEEATRIAALKKGDDDEQQMIGKFTNRKGDPVEALANDAKIHERKSRFFAFASEHFAKDRVYRLSKSDLEILEITTTHY